MVEGELTTMTSETTTIDMLSSFASRRRACNIEFLSELRSFVAASMLHRRHVDENGGKRCFDLPSLPSSPDFTELVPSLSSVGLIVAQSSFSEFFAVVATPPTFSSSFLLPGFPQLTHRSCLTASTKQAFPIERREEEDRPGLLVWSLSVNPSSRLLPPPLSLLPSHLFLSYSDINTMNHLAPPPSTAPHGVAEETRGRGRILEWTRNVSQAGAEGVVEGVRDSSEDRGLVGGVQTRQQDSSGALSSPVLEAVETPSHR
jgi:hypothetical protein